jgi:hypothetical protein
MDVSLWGAVHHASLIRDPMVVTPGHTEMTKPIVEMRGISKRYGGVQALQSVDL